MFRYSPGLPLVPDLPYNLHPPTTCYCYLPEGYSLPLVPLLALSALLLLAGFLHSWLLVLKAVQNIRNTSKNIKSRAIEELLDPSKSAYGHLLAELSW